MSHIQHEKDPLLGGERGKPPSRPPSLMFMYLTVFISSVGFTVVLPSLWYYLDNEVTGAMLWFVPFFLTQVAAA